MLREGLFRLEMEQHIFGNKNYIAYSCYQVFFQVSLQHHLAGKIKSVRYLRKVRYICIVTLTAYL